MWSSVAMATPGQGMTLPMQRNDSNVSTGTVALPAGDNVTALAFQARYGYLHIVLTSCILGVIILCTIIGNVFVVAAIILEKNLQSCTRFPIWPVKKEKFADPCFRSKPKIFVRSDMNEKHLRSLTATCDHENFLKDGFVVGLRNRLIKRRWLQEEKLTLACALTLATAMEAAERDVVTIASSRNLSVMNIRFTRNSLFQSVSNYLIVSLAVADLMVATLVMPISALNELSKYWWLVAYNPGVRGPTRFGDSEQQAERRIEVIHGIGRRAWGQPEWEKKITYQEALMRANARPLPPGTGIHLCDLWICFDILCCTASILHLVGIAVDRYWAVTNVNYVRVRSGKRIGLMIGAIMAISIPARYMNEEKRRGAIRKGECNINDGWLYTIFSTVGAFYLPMLFMIAIYIRIYQAARKRIRKKAFKHPQATSATATAIPMSAARTLAIITGCFLVCWFPFFLRAVICPFRSAQCRSLIPGYGHSLILWLGYMNSLLNPIIYTIFSPDFRNAFSKILFGRYRRRGFR
uniref:G_PROTEIN_RECEP_F1_2 domain-containing protein n=1 Tax=Macrostomum lignano TaxID=282301 RepID=A0A1I8JEN1_9PLAT